MATTQFAVYILANDARVIYVGVTRDLLKRLYQHRNELSEGFAKQHGCKRLVHFELTPSARDAFEREKTIKGWKRIKKIRLIEATNPDWIDLAADWF